jgi:hypothetical protein
MQRASFAATAKTYNNQLVLVLDAGGWMRGLENNTILWENEGMQRTKELNHTILLRRTLQTTLKCPSSFTSTIIAMWWTDPSTLEAVTEYESLKFVGNI